MAPPDGKTLLLGILRWCRQEDVSATRTRIMKLLYLADLHYARTHAGRTATGWGWRLDSFGPLATECYLLLETGAREGWLRHSTGAGDDLRDRETHFYSPADWEGRVDLPEFGRVRRWIKEYGDSTPRLLRFVYGETEPMQEAWPGELLDFSVALPPPPVIEPQKIPHKAMKRLKELKAALVAQHQKSFEPLSEGPYDEAYYAGVPQEEELEPFSGAVSFPESS